MFCEVIQNTISSVSAFHHSFHSSFLSSIVKTYHDLHLIIFFRIAKSRIEPLEALLFLSCSILYLECITDSTYSQAVTLVYEEFI